MSSKLPGACPACEYERGDPGRPVTRGDSIHCLSCGNTWREYSNAALLASHNHPIPTVSRSQKPVFRHNRQKLAKTGSDNPVSIGTGIVIAFAASLFLGLGVATVIYALHFFTHSTGSGKLHVENLTYEELVRGGGNKIVKVEGTITNDTDRTIVLPKVAIVLKTASGIELVRWHYASATQTLKAGEQTRFMSAKPVNAPVISSVEAHIQ